METSNINIEEIVRQVLSSMEGRMVPGAGASAAGKIGRAHV